MSIFSDFTSAATTIGEVALAAETGGASLALEGAISRAALSIGDQILQNVGQQLGLPQSLIDGAQAVFHAEAGDVGGAVQNMSNAFSDLGETAGLSPQDTGALQQQAQSGVDDATSAATDQANSYDPNSWTGDSIREAGGDAKASKGGKGDSLLVALAKAMGQALDQKLNKMYADTQQMAHLDTKSSQYGSLSGEVQALGQEVNLLSNALTNSIKSVGEAGTTLAKKD
jgi:hypothetical protein